MRWNSWLGLKTTGSVSIHLVFSIAASVNTCTSPFKVTSANLFPTIPLAAFSPSSSVESKLTLSSATIPEDRKMSSSYWLKGECCFSQIKNFFKSLVCHDFDKEMYWSEDSSVTSAKASTVPSPEDFPAWCKSNALRRHQTYFGLGSSTANFHRSHLTCSIVMSVQTPHQNFSDRRTVK
ncbi:hypothetical protein AVEN_211957-1 [Araneus ventricosus]|uniref:Uncharacterized protein n=1 Tax=Araneus ventricosus TaxID=182803 RepID=A0A4Y2G1Y2_ARAVE|nr:hypothetical protein AVEN_211957-1 [Araneus ventricosus]